MSTYPFTAYDLRTRTNITIIGKHPRYSRCYQDEDGYAVLMSDVAAMDPSRNRPEYYRGYDDAIYGAAPDYSQERGEDFKNYCDGYRAGLRDARKRESAK